MKNLQKQNIFAIAVIATVVVVTVGVIGWLFFEKFRVPAEQAVVAPQEVKYTGTLQKDGDNQKFPDVIPQSTYQSDESSVEKVTESAFVIVLSLNLNKDILTLKDSDVVRGPGPDWLPGDYEFSAATFSGNGKPFGVYRFSDPRRVYRERELGSFGQAFLENEDFTLIFPHFSDIGRVDISKKEKLLLSVDLSRFAGESPVVDRRSLKVISPNGGENFIAGQEYFLKWTQSDLETWGNVATVCLSGFDSLGRGFHQIHLKGVGDGRCSSYDENYRYFIGNAVLTAGVLKWTVPKDLKDKFQSVPRFYTIQVFVIDDRPQFRDPAEEAEIVYIDESDSFFSISFK